MTTQFLNVNGGTIAYDINGSGPLVLEIPGMGDLRASYRFLTPRLVEAGYQVVSMDVRGHGESSVQWSDYTVRGVGQDIIALTRALDSGPVIWIGNSMAAGAAIWAAAEAPELVKALVFLGPVTRGEVSAPYRLLLSVLFSRPWGPSAWLAYFKKLFPSHLPADYTEYASALKQNLSLPGRMEALYQMIIASKKASEERVQQVKKPTQIIMGSKDPDFKDPAAEARWLAGQMHCEYLVIEGAGHYPHVEKPEISGEKIIDFIKSLELEGKHDPSVYAQSRS